MESLDYRHHRIHTNQHLAHHEDDGSIRLVVAHQDPGLRNWIETAGHESGTMCFRWVRAVANPEPATRGGQTRRSRRAAATAGPVVKRIAETPTDYARPYRPWPVAAFNALARLTPRAGPLRRLDAARMLANARRRTGLQDLGDERCLTALRVLVRAINDEAELTPTGVLLQRQRIEGALANRLRRNNCSSIILKSMTWNWARWC